MAINTYSLTGEVRAYSLISSDFICKNDVGKSTVEFGMKFKHGKSSWVAFALFYLVLLLIVLVLDWFNQVLALPYWGTQAGLITLGVGILAIIGIWLPDLSAARGIFLAFTVGILTIIPAVLMGLGRIPGFWPQYFSVAFGMAAGSFLSFLFFKFFNRTSKSKQSEMEIDHFE
jgi:hypothetical protein